MADSQRMILDPAIRDWVLIPIMVVMVLVGVLRHYITMLITGAPKAPQLKAIRESKALLRGMRLRTVGNNIPQHAFAVRKAYLAEAFEQGTYLKNPEANKEGSAPANPMTDPAMMEGMMEGMKKQMMNMVPQMLIMGWINFFFSGFIVIKLPFPLTPRFKSMLQSGVDTRDMDVSWVSSLSWYFLNLFGLGSVFALILGDNNSAGVDMTAMSSMPGMMPGMGGMGQAPGQAPDFNKLFLAEKENVMITPHIWDMEDVEERLLKKYGKQVKSVASPAIASREVKKEQTVREKIKHAQKTGNKRR
ncbi:transmembrane protein [Backusella circina FSU 941]|nr:transmembrane protein [Backusella circina FSU 941]